MFPDLPRTKQLPTDPQAEVLGAFVTGWLDDQLAEFTRPKPEQSGITELVDERLHPNQTFLNTARAIIKDGREALNTLVSIGQVTGRMLPMSDFETMREFTAFIESIHSVAVHNAPVQESYLVREFADQPYLINNTPTANAITYGWCTELLQQCKIGGVHYKLIPHADYPSTEVGSVFLMQSDLAQRLVQQ